MTERLLDLVPRGRVFAVDALAEMVMLARERLGGRAQRSVRTRSRSTSANRWTRCSPRPRCIGSPTDRLWTVLAGALRVGGAVEVQCGGVGNIARVREAIDAAAAQHAPELVGWSPWVFATHRDRGAPARAGFRQVRCWLQERPTHPADVGAFVRTSILAAHFERLARERRERFAAAVLERVRVPLDYVRLNISAVRA